MNLPALRKWVAGAVLTCLVAGCALGQQAPSSTAPPVPATPSAAPAPAPPVQAHNNVRRAMQWKQSDYTCEGGAKLMVYLRGQMVKVRFGEHVYFMKQTESAEGNRYSDGKIAWWSKGDDGYLQEDTPGSEGKMIAKGCKLEKPTQPKDHPAGSTGGA